MKRVNIKDAFVGEPTSGQEGIEAGDGDEAVILEVRGGEIIAVVPQATADGEVIAAASMIRGALRLENGRVLTFEIHAGTDSAFFEDESAVLHGRRLSSAGQGLSTVRGTDYMARPRTAGEIMTREVIVVSPEMLVEDVAKLLAFHNISGMPVEDNQGKIVGIVSEVDVIGKIGTIVDDVMSRELVTATLSTPIEEIARVMAEQRIRRVPVFDGDRLAGIVTRADIVRVMSERMPTGAEASGR